MGAYEDMEFGDMAYRTTYCGVCQGQDDTNETITLSIDGTENSQLRIP